MPPVFACLSGGAEKEIYMEAIPAPAHYTVEEYLAIDRAAAYRSEYRDGEILAMAGGTRPHSLIGLNIAAEVRQEMKERDCEVHGADMRVRASAARFVYPDVSIVCGEAQLDSSFKDTLLNPTVIIEVLSPSTEADDRGDKFAYYRRLRSLQEYVLISQGKVLVERYLRSGDIWLLHEHRKRADVLHLESINCRVPLSEIYRKIAAADADESI